MLWSLRNKLVLTYLLIGLAPVVLFVTLAGVFAYVAAGQFAIHLADTRLAGELSQMRSDNEHRADLLSHILENEMAGGAAAKGAVPPVLGETERSTNLDVPRMRLHRETQAFVNGAPVALDFMPPANGTRGKTPFELPPWATDLPGGFSGMVLDGKDLYLVVINQRRWKDGRTFSLVNSLIVDSSLLNLIAEGLGYASLLPERVLGSNGEKAGSSQAASRSRSPGSTVPAKDAEVSSAITRVSGGAEPPPVNVVDLTVRFPSTEPVIDWDTGQPDSVYYNRRIEALSSLQPVVWSLAERNRNQRSPCHVALTVLRLCPDRSCWPCGWRFD